jgi:hypothetical protein
VQQGVGVSEIQVVGESPTPQPHPLDNVGGGVAEAVAEDPARGVGAVAPDRECRFEVWEGDVLGAVQRGVERGEADDVRFGAAGGGAKQACSPRDSGP